MKTGGIWNFRQYCGWPMKRTESGEFTATSPDFAIVEIDALHSTTRGQFVSAPDRMSLIGVIDRTEANHA